ncbi:MAG: rhodanese-like domain-containing protein [Blautia sp.]|nr:rhodanese-like domain-containing protein [Blautia sp.]
MGFLDFLKGPDLMAGLSECQGTEGAVLLDVRTRQEYRSGHIPGSVNIPLDEIEGAKGRYVASTPLFVYCLRGTRSRRAVSLLKKMGFERAKSIGGITAYTGKMER